MSYFKLAGGIMGVLALALAAWLIKDRFYQKDLADAAAACAKAAADVEDDASLKPCLSQVASEIREARKARLCERSMLPSLLPENRFAMQQSCGAGVKRLVAVADGAVAERGSLSAQLSDARAASAAAVIRAEVRAIRQEQRTDHGKQAIQAAPRNAAGSVRCDAECLRRLGI
ncbi:MAG: hypothetical protein ABL914_10900 [Novosphingobium sp.]|uniref:hypothetical protein n=1 Tax=Novosphingobium sp. TaxID=1874826 RepID=UPI0032BEF892